MLLQRRCWPLRNSRRPKTVRCSAAGVEQPRSLSPQQQAAVQLINLTGTSTTLEMRPSKHGNGLFTTKPVKRGEVVISVPRHTCLIIDYAAGLSVPATGTWPRLKQGLSAEEPLTWDLLMALALLDGLAGDGGSFWQGYCEAILPAPDSLTLPMCWSEQRLGHLQHSAIVDAALAQQSRLAAMFPEFAETTGEDAPSWFQWAFACVRSRAYKLGPDSFAMVPFWDLANHDVQPNSNFLAEPSGPLKLVALKDMEADQEVLISYTGEEGYTNQRLMAQYGFVLPGGNPADRVPLEMPKDNLCPGLSLERIQTLMGDVDFLDMISAKNTYGYAALKSLPLMDENQDRGAEQAVHGDMALAATLLKQCEDMEAACPTTLQQDEETLQRYQASAKQEQPCIDQREASAVEYRIERKRLLRVCRGILKLYLSEDAAGVA